MKRTLLFIALTTMIFSGSAQAESTKMSHSKEDFMTSNKDSISGYAPVNGYKIYYEIHGHGEPLVLIHGGGSTIQSSFGRVLHSFAKERQVIAVELQDHGHTPHIDRPETFEDDADDVAAVLKYLKIAKADFFGFSNGGNTTMQIAIRHPELVRKIILGSAFFKRDGMIPGIFDLLNHGTLKDMPLPLQQAYKKVAPDTNNLIHMFEKDKNRMIGFRDWTEETIRSIKAPALIIIGDHDVVLPEHAVEMFRLLPHAQLCILPGLHGGYIGEITTGMEHSQQPEMTVVMIEEFLYEPMPKE